MTTSTAPQGRDWSRMQRTDFDPAAPLALVDARAVRRVEAVAHTNGTEALFGDTPRPRRSARRSKPAATPEESTAPLF